GTICPRCNNLADIGALECRYCKTKFKTKSACDASDDEEKCIAIGTAVEELAKSDKELAEALSKALKTRGF
ncbi:unnamed protein product, partial [marine sediment metagenome]